MLLVKINYSEKEIVIMINTSKIIIKILIYQRRIQKNSIIIFICKTVAINKVASFREKKESF